MGKLTRRGLLAGGAAMAAIPFLAGESQGGPIAKQEMPKEGIILVAMVVRSAPADAIACHGL